MPGMLFADLVGGESPAADALWDWARLVPPLIPMTLAVALGELAGDLAGVLDAPPVEAPLDAVTPQPADAEPIVAGETEAGETEAVPSAEAARGLRDAIIEANLRYLPRFVEAART